jgi:hypothetical protein
MATSSTSYTSNGVNISTTVGVQTSVLPPVPDFTSIGGNITTGVSTAAGIISGTFTGAANNLGLSINTPSFVNLPQSVIANNIITQTNAPQWPASWNGTFLTVGNQTTSGLTRGALIYTGINVTNANLTHSCDFKFQFPNLGLNLSAIDPVAAVKKAIAKGKLAAKAAIQMAMTVLNNTFRTAMKSLLAGLGLDATGLFSTSFSVAKGVLQNINEIVNKILRYVTTASTVYYLLQDLQQVITYISNLPAQIKNILQQCLANFTNSLNSSLSSAQGVASQLSNLNSAVSVASAQSASTKSDANTASAITPILNSIYSGNTPSSQLINTLKVSISNTVANAPPSQGSQQSKGQSP